MKIVIVAALLGFAQSKIELGTHKRVMPFFNAYPNYPVLNRVTRAQPAIYPPDKALSWVENYYERSYTPQPYSFAYDVNDGYNNYGHQQQSDGSVTSGSYRVLLPDGRTQVVNFRADKNGYVADVKYEVSLFKSAGSSYKAPVVPSYKAPAGQSNRPASPAWTAFTAYRPDAKKPSYKADLIASLGYKTTARPSAPAYRTSIDQQNKTPAAVTYRIPVAPQYKSPDYQAPAYKPVAAPAQVNNGPTRPEYKSAAKQTYIAGAVPAAPAYRRPANPNYRIPVAPVAPVVAVYQVPVDQAKRTPTVEDYKIPTTRTAPVYRVPAAPAAPVYRVPPAAAVPQYRAPVTPTYQTPSAPESAVVYETPATTYEPTVTTPAYKAAQVYTTYRPPSTASYSAQAIPAYESSTPAPQFNPPWTAFRYPAAETSTTLSYEIPATQAYVQPTTAGYAVAVTTPADRPPPPAYEVSAPAESIYEFTTVPAEASPTPSSQNYAAPWTAFRATQSPVYQSPAVYEPPAIVHNAPSYETSTNKYLNEASTTPATPDYDSSTYVPQIYSERETPSTYEAPVRPAWTEAQRPSGYLPADESTTYKADLADETTTVRTYITTAASPIIPLANRAVPHSATRSPWSASPPTPEASLYVAPTTYRPLTPPAYKVPDARVYESNTGFQTSSSAPAWNAWTAFRSARLYPAGRPGYEAATTPDSSAYKLPLPLVYRNRKA